MSHSYQEQKKSKYTYSNIENILPIYIFVITIKTNNSKNIILRKIRKNKIDTLISFEDSINYSSIKKIKIEVFDINNPTNIIKAQGKINTLKTTNDIYNENIRVSVNRVILGLTECNYQIL